MSSHGLPYIYIYIYVYSIDEATEQHDNHHNNDANELFSLIDIWFSTVFLLNTCVFLITKNLVAVVNVFLSTDSCPPRSGGVLNQEKARRDDRGEALFQTRQEVRHA